MEYGLKRVVALYNNLKLVLYILFFNLIISMIYLIIRLIKKDYKKGLMMSTLMILMPIIGPIYMFVSWLIYEFYFKNHQGILSLEELSLSKKRVEVMKKGNVEAALDKVPLEEALLISDDKDTRRLLLNILKYDTKGYISSIYKATDHEDSEVSHYAATSIADIVDKFKKEEKILRQHSLKNKADIVPIDAYWLYLSEFLKTKILPEPEQRRYLEFLEGIVVELEKDMPSKVTGELYYELVMMFISLEDMKKAEFWFRRAMVNRPEDLASYKAGLKFYYDNNERAKLLELMKDLRESSIRIDQETLEFIRFYNQ